MLTHSPAAAEGSHYYNEGKYYHEEGHAPATWAGQGAEKLGLQGEITDPQMFDDMLNGKLPDGTQLPEPPNGRERRHGDDWTFSPPKSVSIVALVGGDKRVVEAHDRAVQVAVGHMEKEMFGTRALVDGEQQHVSGGAIVGMFQHETSRPVDGISDPQLHTHTVWINASLRQDGEWRATDWTLKDGTKRMADYVYLSELAADLRRCGYELVPTRDAYEIQGIPQSAIKEFGRRAGQIEDELAKGGKTRETSSQAQRQTANLRTREAKEQLSHGAQVDQWQERARDMTLNLESVVVAANGHVSASTSDYELARSQHAQEAVSSAARHLSERQSVFRQYEAARETLRAGLVNGVRLEDVQRAISESAEIVETSTGSLTTKETLAQEKTLLETVRQGRGSQTPIMSESQTDAFLQVHQATTGIHYTPGQLASVKLAVTTNDQVVAILGHAGTGKTLALDAIRQGAEGESLKVVGLAPSAAAARVMEHGAHIHSQTIDFWLASPGSDSRAGIYIVDEAGMVSTRRMAELVERARAQNSRVVLVGDTRQLPAVEAGNPFRALIEDGTPTVTIGEVQRQRDVGLKTVVEMYATGEAGRGAMLASENFHQAENMAEAAARDYLDRTPEMREGTLVLCGTNGTRQAINEHIRSGLREKGLLGREVEARTLHRQNLTREELHRAHSYQAGQVVVPLKDYQTHGVSSTLRKGGEYRVLEVHDKSVTLETRTTGERVEWEPAKAAKVNVYREAQTSLAERDRVVFRENSRSLGLMNGDRGTVGRVSDLDFTVQLDRGGREITLGTDRGARVEHAYATTVHVAQGQTVDHVIIAGETGRLSSAEQAYVSLSRARESARVYTDQPDRLRETWSKWEPKQNALDHMDTGKWVKSHDKARSSQLGSDKEHRSTGGPEVTNTPSVGERKGLESMGAAIGSAARETTGFLKQTGMELVGLFFGGGGEEASTEPARARKGGIVIEDDKNPELVPKKGRELLMHPEVEPER